MADNSRPVGGYIVKQRGPKAFDERSEFSFREPRVHQSLDVAFREAERVARLTGAPFSILQEIGIVEPEVRLVADPEPEVTPEPVQPLAVDDAIATLRAVEWSIDVDMEQGGYEPGCPACGEPRRLGHSPRCRIRASLAKAEGRS